MKIQCNNGTGRPVNPYSANRDLEENEMRKDFNRENPPLPVYKDGELYLGEGEVMVELVWQFTGHVEWHICQNVTLEMAKECGWETRQAYICIPAKEEQKDIDERVHIPDDACTSDELIIRDVYGKLQAMTEQRDELLAALEGIVIMCEGAQKYQFEVYYRDAVKTSIDLAKQAIQKANGK